MKKAIDAAIKKAVKANAAKPIAPSAARRELAALETIYEHTELDSDTYDTVKARIFQSMRSWNL